MGSCRLVGVWTLIHGPTVSIDVGPILHAVAAWITLMALLSVSLFAFPHIFYILFGLRMVGWSRVLVLQGALPMSGGNWTPSFSW